MVVFGQSWYVFESRWLYLCVKVVLFGENSCICVKRWLYSRKIGFFNVKIWLYSGKVGCIRAKVVLLGQSDFIREKVAVIGQIGQNWLYLGKSWLYLGKSGCIWAKLVFNRYKIGCVPANWLYFDKIGCNPNKLVVFGQNWFYLGI